MNDQFIKDHFKSKKFEENFTVVRTREQLYFMFGCLYTNFSNKIVYASEFKHSISEDFYKLVNPDPKSKSKFFKHMNIKELISKRERTNLLKLFQVWIPDAIDLNKDTYISGPTGCKYSNIK